MYCRKCGRKIDSESRLCRFCGFEVALKHTGQDELSATGRDVSLRPQEDSEHVEVYQSALPASRNKGATREAAGRLLAAISGTLMGILGALIHICTIVLAYSESGLFAAFLSLIFPVLSQIYWGIVIWSAAGTIVNLYCMALLGYVALFVLSVVGSIISDTA